MHNERKMHANERKMHTHECNMKGTCSRASLGMDFGFMLDLEYADSRKPWKAIGPPKSDNHNNSNYSDVKDFDGSSSLYYIIFYCIYTYIYIFMILCFVIIIRCYYFIIYYIMLYYILLYDMI